MEFQEGHWPEIEGDEFLLNLGDQWLYQPVAGAEPNFGTNTPVKWGDSARSGLQRIVDWVDYWRGQGKEAYPAHLGSGDILWLDFDGEPSDEQGRELYAGWLANCIASTYTEKSRTPGRFHAAFRLPSNHGLLPRSIKIIPGLDQLIAEGWIRVTGNSNGLPIADIPDPVLETLRRLNDERRNEYSFDGVPISEVEGDPALCALPLDEAISETRRRMVESSSRTKTGFNYQELIEGPAGLDEANLSESRAALIQWAAKITCGHREQHEIVWRIVSESYLAEQTPFISKQNQRRFTAPSKVNYDRFNLKGEYHKLIGLANREVERDHAEGEAQRTRMEGVALARKDKRLASRAYWERVPLSDFPVPVYRSYRDWLRASTIKSNARIIEAAALAHLAHLLGNRVAGPTGVFPAIFIIVPAPAGSGKEAASYEVMQRLAPKFTFSLGSPGSGGGFHAALLDPNCHGIGFAMIDEYQDFLGGKGDSPHVRSSVTTLKTVFGKMQLGKELPAMRLVKDSRAAVPQPAVTMLGIGIEDDIFTAFATSSLNDGFFARHLFPDMGVDLGRFRNRCVAASPPKQLLDTVNNRLNSLPKLPQAPFARAVPERVWFESYDLEEEAYRWACEVDDLREGVQAGTRFGEMLRAVSENAQRLATGMAAWSEERVISRAIWEWCKGYVINSVAYLLAKDEEGCLDAGASALAQRIHIAMGQFFDGRGNQHPTQIAMREAGRFRLGSLPNYRRIEDEGAKINRANPMMPIEAAVALLKGRGVLEVLVDHKDFTKRVYCKGAAFDVEGDG